MALVKIEGLGQLNQALDRVSGNIRRRGVRAALYRAAAFIRDEARRNAPKDTELLKKSIVVRSSRSAGRSGVAYKVGLMQRAWYGRLVEFGHVARGPGGQIWGGDRRRALRREAILRAGGKFVPPRPFMRPAAQKLDQAMELFTVELRDKIGSGELLG